MTRYSFTILDTEVQGPARFELTEADSAYKHTFEFWLDAFSWIANQYPAGIVGDPVDGYCEELRRNYTTLTVEVED